MKHVLMIGQQLIRRLKVFHSFDYVHGDIKPANIMFGRGKHKNTLYLIDFGLSRHQSKLSGSYKHNYPADIYKKDKLNLNGNPLHASVNQHLGWNKMFKKDDIESFVYLLINLAKGCLPWSTIPIEDGDNYYNIYKAKRDVDSKVL